MSLKQIRLVTVQFHEFGKDYTYYCDDENILEDHYVIVPVGQQEVEKIARVSRVFHIYHDLSQPDLFPFTQLKKVLKRYVTFDEKRAETIVDIQKKYGNLLDLSKCEAVAGSEIDGTYDILKTPMGHFWLALNGVPIPMVISSMCYENDRYPVDQAIRIRAEDMTVLPFKSLELCADFDIDGARYVDVLSDEYGWGSSWVNDGVFFGITGDEGEIDTQKYSNIPYYEHWQADNPNFYWFGLAWKPFLSDDDLSLDFCLT